MKELVELEDASNSLLFSIIEHKKRRHLAIIENIVYEPHDKCVVDAFILDLLDEFNIDQKWFTSVAIKWFYEGSSRYPLSFAFSQLGRGDVCSKIIKTFTSQGGERLSIRVVGRLFSYDLYAKPKIKRRRVDRAPDVPSIALS